MPTSRVIIRLGSHAEKDYLLKTAKLFDGVIVGANLLEMTPGATASLAWKFASIGRPFIVDPLTYVFALDQAFISSEQKNRRTGAITLDMKKSFQKLCKAFGGPFEIEALNRKVPVVPANFGSPESIQDLAQSVFNYQVERMKAICEADLQLKDFAERALPSVVFSPYFYIPGDNEASSADWERLCLDAIDAFGLLASSVPKHSILCFSRRILKDRDRLMRIVQRAMRSGCDACWFWISNFKEEDITPSELTNLVIVVRAAQDSGYPLYNLHGGFLSALLSKHGLHGFSHSIGYGESKDVFPVSGGALPTVSYHYNPLHVKSSVPDIERAFSTLGIATASLFHENICDCSICVGTLKGNIRNFRKFGELVLKAGNSRESQTAESAKRCRFHFLLARKKEIDFVNRNDAEALRIALSQVVSEYEQLPYSIKLKERSQPLKNWLTLL